VRARPGVFVLQRHAILRGLTHPRCKRRVIGQLSVGVQSDTRRTIIATRVSGPRTSEHVKAILTGSAEGATRFVRHFNLTPLGKAQA
jgi:hypothetical protein